jgi:hypothetical protein
LDDARRQENLLAEDPRAGVDDDVARADFIGGLINLSDPSGG